MNIIKKDISSELKDSYKDYAMAVVLDRALPDIRDGLKPVQRRIVYGMRKNGNTSDKPYVKSARIVGDVMGKYHPHGDCLFGDTVFFTVNGDFKTIKELYENDEEPYIIAYDINSNEFVFKKAENLRIGQYTDKIYKISFNNGDFIKCTNNHPFLMDDKEYKKAEKLCVGDRMFSSALYFDKKGQFNNFISKSDVGLKSIIPDISTSIYSESFLKLVYDTCEKIKNSTNNKQGFLVTEHLYVESIEIINTNNEPMYDFTVKDCENAMIPIGSSRDNYYTMICAHNSSIYGAMVNMAQDFSTNIPLVDGQGNFGTIDGDGAAAMRYTEARMSQYAEEITSMLSDNIADYTDNFDGSLKEPVVLPTITPNLLVNGSYGIAVGISTNIPPFNLGEIIDASTHLIKTPNARENTIINYIKGPDFPCGGTIDASNMADILKRGNGSFDIYATIEERKGNLYITEIPQTFSGNKEGLIVDIAKKAESGKIPEIVNIEDQSADDVLIEIKLKRGTDPEQVKAKLYKYTGCKSSFPLNFTAVNGDKVVEFGIIDYLKTYIDYAKESLVKKLKAESKNLEKKLTRLNTIIFASENIELMVEIITKSNSIESVKKCMAKGDISSIKFSLKKYEQQAKKLRLTDEEIDIILQTKLSSLVKTDIVKVRKEADDVKKRLKTISETLKNKEKLNDCLVKEMINIKKNFGKTRKTVIKEEVKLEEIKEVELPVEEVYALIDILGYIKFINKSSMGNNPDLNGYTVIPIMNNDRLGFFYEDGYIRYIDVKDLPVGSINAKGEAIDHLTDAQGLKYFTVLPQEEIEKSRFIFVSKDGYGKIVDGSEYKPTGTALYRKILASKLNKNDIYIDIRKITDEEFIEVESNERVLKFKTDEISTYGKSARGMILLNKKYLPLTTVRYSEFKASKTGKRAGAGEVVKIDK